MAYTRSILSLALVVAGVASAVGCAASTTDDGSVAGDPQALTECDSTGTWAMKIVTPVKWNATFVIQAGTGTVTNWALSKRTQNGTTVTDAAKICGIDTPPYQATATFGAERFGTQFAGAVFDAPAMPSFTINATLSSKEVGATFTAPPIAALVGATLANPATDPWPANIASVDADGDGKPGITANTATGPGLTDPPVNPTRTARAHRIYTAVRQVLSVSGTVKSCERSEGEGTIAVINNKPAIDQRVVGCSKQDGSECVASEFKLLDGAAPVYQPTDKAKVVMVKVPDTASCADVRAFNFDQ